MNKIEAIVKPFKLDEIKDALHDKGIVDLVISDVRIFGQKNEKSEVYEGGEYIIDSLPKVKLELLLPVEKTSLAIDVIKSIADTGRNGDGYITIYSVEKIIDLSTAF